MNIGEIEQLLRNTPNLFSHDESVKIEKMLIEVLPYGKTLSQNGVYIYAFVNDLVRKFKRTPYSKMTLRELFAILSWPGMDYETCAHINNILTSDNVSYDVKAYADDIKSGLSKFPKYTGFVARDINSFGLGEPTFSGENRVLNKVTPLYNEGRVFVERRIMSSGISHGKETLTITSRGIKLNILARGINGVDARKFANHNENEVLFGPGSIFLTLKVTWLGKSSLVVDMIEVANESEANEIKKILATYGNNTNDLVEAAKLVEKHLKPKGFFRRLFRI